MPRFRRLRASSYVQNAIFITVNRQILSLWIAATGFGFLLVFIVAHTVPVPNPNPNPTRTFTTVTGTHDISPTINLVVARRDLHSFRRLYGWLPVVGRVRRGL